MSESKLLAYLLPHAASNSHRRSHPFVWRTRTDTDRSRKRDSRPGSRNLRELFGRRSKCSPDPALLLLSTTAAPSWATPLNWGAGGAHSTRLAARPAPIGRSVVPPRTVHAMPGHPLANVGLAPPMWHCASARSRAPRAITRPPFGSVSWSAWGGAQRTFFILIMLGTFLRPLRKGCMSCGVMKRNWRSGCASQSSMRVSTAILR
mmetsp:Transcript_44205/g.122528  ORF Transcript_44205/g.122528 Transcript_44205/m.122528 type:complete len:205 (+) Transcript_44205:79-693(+)